MNIHRIISYLLSCFSQSGIFFTEVRFRQILEFLKYWLDRIRFLVLQKNKRHQTQCNDGIAEKRTALKEALYSEILAYQRVFFGLFLFRHFLENKVP